MVGTQKIGNRFFIRFEDVSAVVSKRNGVLVVDKNHEFDFFNLVEQFGLNVSTGENGTFAVMPAHNEKTENLEMHISTWDIVFHKFFSYSNDFWRANAEHHRKIAMCGKTIQFPTEVPQAESMMG